MKGRKEIEEMIEKSGHREILTSHENILRSYIMEKSVLPKLKRDSQAQSNNRGSIFRSDTLSALNNLMHQRTFMDDLRNRNNTSKKRVTESNNQSKSSNRKVTFNDSKLFGKLKDLLFDFKQIVVNIRIVFIKFKYKLIFENLFPYYKLIHGLVNDNP